jgi:hypothetical protein
MDKPWSVIWALESHPSRINKEQIIEVQAEANNREFFEGCRMALDPLITFGIKQVPEKTDADGPGLDWDSFTLILTGFVNRSFTGNLARDTIAEMMKNSTREQWNGWYRRILIKDLRCGVSEKTINKVVEKQYADYAIPVFGCQLAHDSANHETKVAGKKLIEVKLDGVRVITIVYPDGRVDQFSRNGKELVNFEQVKKQFESVALAGGIKETMVFDGEIMSSSFQDLMKQVHRKSDVPGGDGLLVIGQQVGRCAPDDAQDPVQPGEHTGGGAVAQRDHHPVAAPRQPRHQQHDLGAADPGAVGEVVLQPQPRLGDPRPVHARVTQSPLRFHFSHCPPGGPMPQHSRQGRSRAVRGWSSRWRWLRTPAASGSRA